MITQDNYRSGDIYAIFYTFDAEGDGIAYHVHVPGQEHNVLCLKGKIAVYGDDWYRELEPGDVLDLDCSRRHEIASLQVGSKIVNTYLHGIPEGYAELPDSELHTRYESKPLSTPRKS